ncbi:MAG: hypothetical protein JWO69_421, partial [Thermoleophilia bacterium]|nr:hypothetical protein [Thermoleophilia bacterium]
MVGMGSLVQDVFRIALGYRVGFSLPFWAFVTGMLLMVGPLIVQVGPRFVDPPARFIAARPDRVGLWMPLSLVATLATVFFLFVTVLAAPLAIFVPIVAIFVGGIGYLATARLVGERLFAKVGVVVAPGVAALIGIILFRLVRLVPYVGAAAHTFIAWVGYAAMCAIIWAGAMSWYRRRMPDARQFEGETLVEWYPDGDPDDGRPSIGTGRP